MDKDKSPPLPPSSSSCFVKLETSSSSTYSFSHDISEMPDNPPRNRGHRRAHSEILTLPDDITFDSDLSVVGVAADGPSFSDEADEDLLSLYLDMDKLNSSSATSMPEPSPTASANNKNNVVSERPRVRHHHHAADAFSAKSFCNEILILSSISHPNLLRLHGYLV